MDLAAVDALASHIIKKYEDNNLIPQPMILGVSLGNKDELGKRRFKATGGFCCAAGALLVGEVCNDKPHLYIGEATAASVYGMSREAYLGLQDGFDNNNRNRGELGNTPAYEFGVSVGKRVRAYYWNNPFNLPLDKLGKSEPVTTESEAKGE